MKQILLILLTCFSLTSIGQPLMGIINSSQNNAITPTCNQNLLLWSEDINNAVWIKSNASVSSSNSEYDLTGGLTMETLSSSFATCSIYQIVTVVPNTTYRFSFDVKRGTSTDLKFQVRDNTHFVDFVAPTSYYSSTSSTVQRVSVPFTTTPECVSVKLFIVVNNPVGTAYIGRVQLETNSSCYITTTSSIITP